MLSRGGDDDHKKKDELVSKKKQLKEAGTIFGVHFFSCFIRLLDLETLGLISLSDSEFTLYQL